jgi:hypothetical protein
MGFNKHLCFLEFLLYGIYAAATEGVSKAWINNISNERILRLLSVLILQASTISPVPWRVDLVPVWRGFRFQSICHILSIFIFHLTTEKSNINILP